MICLYDNSKNFQDAISEVTFSFNKENEIGDCSGPLYILMKGG
jgi:hypothetical protein